MSYQTIYTTEPIVTGKRSIFLAGPSPRTRAGRTWRPEAHMMLSLLDFEGIVFDPECRNGPETLDFSPAGVGYPADWEWDAIHASTIVVFWVPRDQGELIGMTTNVEFGRYVQNDNVLYGRPDHAYRIKYLDWLWKKENKTPEIFTSMRPLLEMAVKMANARHP